MKWYGILGVAAYLIVLAGCSKGQGDDSDTTSNGTAGLNATERNLINSLRAQDWAIFTSSPSTVAESQAANKSAVYHAGYLASMTSGGQASAGGTVENDDTLPLATDTGSASQSPDNRLSQHSSGALPTANDEVYEYYLQSADDYAASGGFVTDAGGNPSRVLTMWYSRTGRRLLERNQFSLFGFGSVAQAQSFDLRVPNPPNNAFLNGQLLGAFVLIYDTTLARDKAGIWPAASSSGSAFDVHRFSTDDNGTGCPISVHASVPIVSLSKFKLEAWNGSAFAWTGPAAPFTLWGASDIRASPTLTNVTLSFSQDADYLPSEICFVPNTPLSAGLYRMEIEVNGAIFGGAWFFNIVP